MSKNKTLIFLTALLLILFGVLYVLGNKSPDINFNEEEARSLNEIKPLYTQAEQIKVIENKIRDLESYFGGNEKNYTDYYLYIELAQQYMLLGKGVESATLFQKAKDEEPQKSFPYVKLGGLYSNAGLIDRADWEYKEAIKKEPDLTRNYLYAINFLIKDKKADNSEIQWYFDKARENTGDDEEVLRLYAQWLTEIGEYIRAYDIWKFVLNQNPEDGKKIKNELNRLTRIINNEI